MSFFYLYVDSFFFKNFIKETENLYTFQQAFFWLFLLPQQVNVELESLISPDFWRNRWSSKYCNHHLLGLCMKLQQETFFLACVLEYLVRFRRHSFFFFLLLLLLEWNVHVSQPSHMHYCILIDFTILGSNNGPSSYTAAHIQHTHMRDSFMSSFILPLLCQAKISNHKTNRVSKIFL